MVVFHPNGTFHGSAGGANVARVFALHISPRSVAHHGILALCKQLGLQPEQRVLGQATMRPEGAHYVRIKSLERAPTLVDGDLSLWSSDTILPYVAEEYADCQLWSRDARTRAEIAQWLRWNAWYWRPAMTAALGLPFPENRFNRRGYGSSANYERDEHILLHAARALEEHLCEHAFVGGRELCIADFALAAMMLYSQRAEFPRAQLPNICAWYARIEALEAWQLPLHEEMGLSSPRPRIYRPMLEVLLARVHPRDELLAALSQGLARPLSDFACIDELVAQPALQSPPVVVDVQELASDCFPQIVGLSGEHGLHADIELAMLFARAFGEEALGSPNKSDGPASRSPSSWLKASPDGRVELVYGDADDDDEIFRLFPDKRFPWPSLPGHPVDALPR